MKVAGSLLMGAGAGVGTKSSTSLPRTVHNRPVEGFDFGDSGYDPAKKKIGFNEQTGECIRPRKTV